MSTDEEKALEKMLCGCYGAIMQNYLSHSWNEWDKFCEEIQHKNRFFPESDFMKYIHSLTESRYKIILEKANQQIFYRARCINLPEKTLPAPKDQIMGFDADHSGAPSPDKASSGRANPTGIQYLYLASDEATACSEVCPDLYQLISVAKFKLNRDICVVDLHQIDLSGVDKEKKDEIFFAMTRIMWEFMKPQGSKNDTAYAVSQYIAGYLKKCGLDGIKYISSHNPSNTSFNLVLFDTGLASCISENGDVYRCIGEQMMYQKMRMGLKDDEKIIKSERSPILFSDEEIDEIRRRLIEQKQKNNANSID